MKKIISLIIAAAMLLALGVTLPTQSGNNPLQGNAARAWRNCFCC